MKGLTLSELYYKEEWKPRFSEQYPFLTGRIAAGLVGEGSECFGYDDAVSRDHDYGPGFCIWLLDEDYRRYGAELQMLYDSLPGDFAGVPRRVCQPEAEKRVGVHPVSGFYGYFLGKEAAGIMLSDSGMNSDAAGAACARVPEERLATCTNGAVFEDGPGVFTRIRNSILSYYPEDVRRQKIADEVFLCGQSGQYNYARAMRHGEFVAAELAKNEFIRAALHLCFLLNKQYEPYYKWAHRAAKELPLLKGVPVLLETLVMLPQQKEAWRDIDDPYVNLKDQKVQVIEQIAGLIVKELKAQNMTRRDDAFLVPHADSVLFS